MDLEEMLSKPICYPNVLGEVNTNASPVEPDSQESQPDETTLNARDAHLQLEKEVSVRSHIGVLQHLVIRPEQPQQQPTPNASPRIMPQTQKKDGFERPPTPSIRVNQVNSSSVAVLRDKSQPTKAPFSFSFSPPLSVLSPPSSEDAQDSPSPLTQSPPAFNDTMIPALDTKRPREPTSRQTLVPIETLCRPNSPTPPVTRAVVSGSDRVQGMHTTGGAISDKISPVSSHPVSVNEDAGEPEFKRVKKLKSCKCDICEKKFSNEWGVRRHKATAHPDSGTKQFRCERFNANGTPCNYKTFRHDHLLIHYKKHQPHLR